jgi:hypothetical protein
MLWVFHLIHHVVEGVTRPSFGAASAFSGVACMALKVFPVSVLVLDVERRPWKDVVSPVRKNYQIALDRQVNVNPIIV